MLGLSHKENLMHANGDNARGVLLLAMGGPSSPDEVQPYLTELFSDPWMIRLPFGRLYRRSLARWIASRRAPASRERYRIIGGASPILAETRRLAGGLESKLAMPTTFAMRYSKPRIGEALADLADRGVVRLVVVPLHPQYSWATTRSALDDLSRQLGGRFSHVVVSDHHDHPGFIRSLALQTKKALRGVESVSQVHLLFCAHSIPLRQVAKGDPYVPQVRRTAAFLAQEAGDGLPWTLAFQSRVGPLRWQGPSLEEALADIRTSNADTLVVQPITFSTENLETLYDLDVDFRAQCLEAGIRSYRRAAAPGASSVYLDALADMVRKALASWEGQ